MQCSRHGSFAACHRCFVCVKRCRSSAEGSEAGDAVYLEGSSPAGEYPKILKSDPWKKIVAALSVQSGKATFEGTALQTDKGVVRLPDEMPDGAGIH